MADTHADARGDALPSIQGFVALAYLFLLVSAADHLLDPTAEVADAFGLLGAGVVDDLVAGGILVAGGAALLGFRSRARWGVVGSAAVFTLYGTFMLYGDALTTGGVALLCALYVLSRADVAFGAGR